MGHLRRRNIRTRTAFGGPSCRVPHRCFPRWIQVSDESWVGEIVLERDRTSFEPGFRSPGRIFQHRQFRFAALFLISSSGGACGSECAPIPRSEVVSGDELDSPFTAVLAAQANIAVG